MVTALRRRRAPERSIQAAGVRLLMQLGARVWTLGTTRRRGDHPGTMQTPGLPDVLAFLPPRDGRLWRLLVWEAKAPKGRLSTEQALFRDLCQFAGVDHVVGDLDALIAWLVHDGRVAPAQLPHYRVPRPGTAGCSSLLEIEGQTA